MLNLLVQAIIYIIKCFPSTGICVPNTYYSLMITIVNDPN